MKKAPQCVKSLFAVAAAMILFAMVARAVDYHVSTAQQLQSALFLAANDGADDYIYLTNGYYNGNFSFNSSEANNITLLAEPGVTNTGVTIDGNSAGSGLSIYSSASTNTITVQGISFAINCGTAGTGSATYGALVISAGQQATIFVTDCRFFSPVKGVGNGLVIVSASNVTLNGCTVVGAAGQGSGGNGIVLADWSYAPNFAANVTVLNCSFLTNQEFGLAVTTFGSLVAVSNNVFVGNWVGGLSVEGNYSNWSTVTTASHNIFTGNGVKGSGGYYGPGAGIVNAQTATVTSNTFSNNGSSAWMANGGLELGGVAVVTVTGNEFIGNLTGTTKQFGYDNGGGGVSVRDNNNINHFTTSLTITGNHFLGNSGADLGGAIQVDLAEAAVTIQANSLEQNTAAGDGGSVYVSAPTVTFSDNLVAGNRQTDSSSTGGGVWLNPTSELSFINNTITSNTSSGGGGGAAFQINGSVEVLNVFNNIIWGNSGTTGADVWLSGTGKERVFSNNDANSIFGVWDLFENNLDINPQFVAVGNGNYQLQSSSPCINAGANSAPSLPSTDLNGNSRIVGGSVDMGCYEYSNMINNATLSPPIVSGGLVQIPFTVGNAAGSSFHLLQASQINGLWTTNTSALLVTNVAGASYSFIVPVSGPQEFYRILSP